ncbi:MAG: hypothetical protein JNL40_01865 [Cyclobacteriaceae bacterium]|nr:hypothetical protein [Cyclobacteriaceae bacterium]
MKNRGRIWMSVGFLLATLVAWGQSAAPERMDRDLEVAENILGTLLRQEAGRRSFFPVEVRGNYVAGYGVTFRLPLGGGMNRFAIAGFPEPPDMVNVTPDGFSYSYSRKSQDQAREEVRSSTRVKTAKAPKAAMESDDSLESKIRDRFMEVSKNFLADYGDVISGLKADERIVITNRSDNFEPEFDMIWVNGGGESRRPLLSVEARRGDIDQLKQGKISRAEFMNRLKVVNTETTESLDPDLEVLSSLFGRLYREDLSKTYYVQGNVRYERLKDFGVMYYMKVYSSTEMEGDRFMMPTQNLRDVSQKDRDAKVKELYPKFESELKENIVEYGRTLRSLKENEQLVFNVRLTKCEGCGIPAELEVAIKSSALKDYSAGKATKEATIGKITLKKTGVQ